MIYLSLLKQRMGILRGVLSVALIAVLLFWVSPTNLFDALQNITWQMVGYLLLISVVLIYISVLKWQVLLQAQGKSESILRLYGLYLVGYFVNLLFPSFVGGDAMRSWYLGKQHGHREAAAATLLERYSGLVAMLLLACLFMWSCTLVTDMVRLTILGIAIVFVLTSFFLLSQTAIRALSSLPVIGETVSKQGALLQEAVRLGLGSPKTIFFVFLYSFLFHCMAVVNVLACAYAVGWHGVPIADLFVVLPVILILSAIPLTPQGLGIQEGAFVYYLTLLGATSGQALGVALIIRGKAYVLALCGGLYWLRTRRATPLAFSSEESIPEELPEELLGE